MSKGLSWLDGKAWSDVTRDERYFCAELFFLARQDVKGFVRHLNDAHNANMDVRANWELAYEAVFYRDVWQERGKKGRLFSKKRTFDLVLFSDDDILIIEAKAQQGFDTKQLVEFARDKKEVAKRVPGARVRLAALASSRYRPRTTTREYFDGPMLTWAEMATLYGGDATLARADSLYGA